MGFRSWYPALIPVAGGNVSLVGANSSEVKRLERVCDHSFLSRDEW